MGKKKQIQVYIDHDTYVTIEQDKSFFKMKSINFLVNKIIESSYVNQREQYFKSIKIIEETLKRRNFDNELSKEISSEILRKNIFTIDKGKLKTKRLVVYIVNQFKEVFVDIEKDRINKYFESIELKDIIRDILTNYSRHSRAQREIMLFADNYKELSNSLLENEVRITLSDSSLILFEPYGFINPFDNESTYILGKDMYGNTKSFRLCNIENVIRITTKKKFPESKDLLDKMKEVQTNPLNLDNLVNLIEDDNVLNIIDKLHNVLAVYQRRLEDTAILNNLVNIKNQN